MVDGFFALLILTSCDDYPKDARHTLETVKAGVLHVGLVENPPWVVRDPSGAGGVEPHIIRELAEDLNAKIQWHWSSTGVMVRALKAGQVHMVAGGFISGPELPTTVSSTNPYFTTHYIIGARSEALPVPTNLEGAHIGIATLSPARDVLEREGAQLQTLEQAKASQNPVAAPQWYLQAQGYTLGDASLLKQKHVMLVRKGESAWLKAVQTHLNNARPLTLELHRQVKSP